MRAGKFFRIPEGPADIERLWQGAARAELPSWLAPAGPDAYRYVGSASCRGDVAHEREEYRRELGDLEAAGLVVEADADNPRVHHVWVPRPAFEQVWSIGIYAGPSPLRLAPPDNVRNPVLTRNDVADVPAAFVADPFMLQVDGRWHMFFEVMNWRSGKGEVGLAISLDGREWTYRQIVMEESFHLSYPYVFEWQGEYYLIPESFQAGAVRLYRASRFPTEWSFVDTLLSGPYFADNSIFRHEGRWWLFTDASPDRRHGTVRLYYADDLLGPWVEHPMSPIVAGDVRMARPAGRVVAVDGKVVRYAQNCCPRYGSEVLAFEVVELTTAKYRERPAGRRPVLTASAHGWNADGMHHVDPHLLDDGAWIACVDGWRSGETASRGGRRAGLSRDGARNPQTSS